MNPLDRPGVLVIGGLLPSSVLSSTPFRVFAAVVAFNTLLYLGLTLAKFFPWPAQVHPRTIRRLLATDIEPHDVAPLATFVPEVPRAPLDRPSAYRAAATEAIPLALTIFAITIMGIELLSLAVENSDVVATVAMAVFSAGTLVMALVSAKNRARPALVVTLWLVSGSVYVAIGCWRMFVTDDPLVVAQLAVVFVVLAPIAMVWWPSVLTLAGLLVGSSVSVVVTNGVESIPASVVLLSAMGVGLVLLYLRRRVIGFLLIAQASAYRHATTDPVTGLLERRTLCELGAGLAGAAAQAGRPLRALYVGVGDVSLLGDEYGLGFVDEIVRGLRDPMVATVGGTALVGRVDDAGIAAVWVGPSADVDSTRRAVEDSLERSRIGLGRRPLVIRVGRATLRGVSTDHEWEPTAEVVERLLGKARRRADRTNRPRT